MAVHQLDVFWRDAQARCFTTLYFQPAPGERAAQRAKKILSVLANLSSLQLYGAALDASSFPVEAAKPAPTTGTEERLEVDLLPAAPLNPRAGINKIKFSIPGPNGEVSKALRGVRSAHPAWRSLVQEIFPFLCLHNGTKTSDKPGHVARAAIVPIAPERRPQPQQPPFESAIAATEQDLEIARRQNTNNTKKELERIEKYRSKLSHLQTLEPIESAVFDSSSKLASTQPPVSSTTLLPAALTLSAIKAQPIKDEVITKEEVMPKPISQDLSQKEESAMPTSNIQNPDNQNPYLPELPTKEQLSVWADVAQAHFSDLSLWMSRQQLKSVYGLNERAYFRWMNRLEQYGLNRSLPAKDDDRIKLFYVPDLEQAAERAATNKPRPGRRLKASLQPSQMPNTQTMVAGENQTGSITTIPIAGPSPQYQPDTVTVIAQMQAQIASLQAQQQNLKEQQQVLASSINRLEDSLSALSQQQLPALQAQINQLAHNQSTQADQLHSLPSAALLELANKLANFDLVISTLNKLDSHIKRLPARLGAQPLNPKSIKAKISAPGKSSFAAKSPASKIAKPKSKTLKPKAKRT